MAHADVIALAQLFALDEADTNALERFYTDAVRDLGQASDHMTNITLITGVAEQAVYTATNPAVRILAAFYGQRELWPESYAGLGSAIGPDWRDAVGEPVSYTTLDTSDRSIRLFPVPVLPGQAFVPLTGLFGAAYPDYNVFVAHTEERSNVPVYLELYLALTILAREFTRDSPHQDLDFASAASMLAATALAVVG